MRHFQDNLPLVLIESDWNLKEADFLQYLHQKLQY